MDYKSHAEETAARYRTFFEATKMEIVDLPPQDNATETTERSRLESNVIETAKADWRASKAGDGSNTDIDEMIRTRNARNAAVEALIEFESQQETK